MPINKINDNLEIIWPTLGGVTDRAEDNELIIAEVKIFENNELIVDTKINFAKKLLMQLKISMKDK